MKSIWTDTVELSHFPTLNEDLNTDVLIIGGGMAGILCAYMLNKASVSYALVEADKICGGVTRNTTAKITSQHGLIYDKLIHEFGVEKAKMYLDANEEAGKIYQQLCKNIDCDYEVKDSYAYSCDDKECIEKELKALEAIGYNAEYAHALLLPFETKGAVKFNNQAQFNPLKFISGIVKDLNIYENTKVTELGECTAKTDCGTIHADKIVVATHFPILNKHGAYFIKMYQERSYVLALENAANVEGMYIDANGKGLSFRNYDKYLLLGGGGHRTGKDGGKWQELSRCAREYYPDAVEKYRFATQDCMSIDNVPYIGLYGKKTRGLYVATGFNKWGMTSSMISALIIRDMICGKDNEFASVFIQPRKIMRPQLFVNMGEAVKNMLTYSKRRCPHLGCALKWNKEERTWDCACHGSRFEESGKLINNPANDDKVMH